jgi:hypothetical protein
MSAVPRRPARYRPLSRGRIAAQRPCSRPVLSVRDRLSCPHVSPLPRRLIASPWVVDAGAPAEPPPPPLEQGVPGGCVLTLLALALVLLFILFWL